MVRVPTSTLKLKSRREKLLIGVEIQSPSTPHRIELRSDSSEEITTKDNHNNDCKQTLFLTQPPKKRKKLLTETSDNGVVKHSKKKEKINKQTDITNYFPVRRSVRKTSANVLQEKQLAMEYQIRKEIEDGLEVRYFDGKGRGVVACKNFNKGDFVVEYSGELVDINVARKREEKYAQNENAGCYMYYFKYNEIQYCIDATEESGRLGRLVNHSRNGNLITKTVPIDKKPRLILIAKYNIQQGEELLYDYGDRSKESLRHYPWLAS